MHARYLPIDTAAVAAGVRRTTGVLGALEPYLTETTPDVPALRALFTVAMHEMSAVLTLLYSARSPVVEPAAAQTTATPKAAQEADLDDGVPLPPPVVTLVLDAQGRAEARAKAWATRRERYGEKGHAGGICGRPPIPHDQRIDLSQAPSGMETLAASWRAKGGAA